MVDSAHIVKSTPLRAFTEYFQLFCRYVTDILKFDAEKLFFKKLIGPLT